MTEIEKYSPCIEAIKYRKQFNTFKEAWDNCHRGDWMLWIAVKLEINHRQLTLAKAYCAETVIHLMQDERSIQAVKVAKRYGRNRATKGQFKAAADAAFAAYAAYPVYPAFAAYAAFAYSGAYSAAYSASAVYADADARIKNQKITADICRKYLTDAVMAKIKALK